MVRQLLVLCPSCSGRLAVNRLTCPECRIDIQGDFALPALLRLSPSHLDFVEVFIKNRGVIREVERELGVSYPTVRARLDEVIRALGYQDRAAEESAQSHSDDVTESKRRAVLEQLRSGDVTPEQALAALRERRRDQGKEDSEK